MIDTIAIKYHNVNKFYPDILKRVFVIGKADKKARFQSNQNLVAGKIFQSFQCFIKIPSSGYDINFFYQENDDCLRVSLSIPKYYYGQNIAQHIMSIATALDNQLNYQLELVYTFIRDFNRDILGTPICGQDIEIERLDFCFNIIFSSKGQSLQFLQMIKEQKVKYLGDRSNLYVYNTSIQYRGDGYSWKFYHKGTEVKNTVSEHQRQFADRIMRFEVTIRRRKMSLLVSKMFPEREEENDTKIKFFAADVWHYPMISINQSLFVTIGNFFIEKFLELVPYENYTYSFDLPPKIRTCLVTGGIDKAVRDGFISVRTAQRYKKHLREFINPELLKTKLDFDISYQTYLENVSIFALNHRKSVKIY